MISRIARCHCGQLELRCDGDPKKVSMCHCLECQRRTGSAFSIAVFYERGEILVENGVSNTYTYERESASGFPVKFHFCGRCGSNVYWEPTRLPELIGVALGSFADPGFPCPEQSVWTKDKHTWLGLPDGIETFQVNPPPRNIKT